VGAAIIWYAGNGRFSDRLLAPRSAAEKPPGR